MIISQSDRGLYEFYIEVIGLKKRKKFKGIVDTGSNECACTYKVITTLQIRPICYEMISAINSELTRRTLVYGAYVSFDGKDEIIELYRVNNMPSGIDFIMGMSMLSRCTFSKKNNHLEIYLK